LPVAGDSAGNSRDGAIAAAPVKLVIVDQDPLARRAVRQGMSARADVVVVAEAASCEEAIRVLTDRASDVVVLDAALPPMGGIAAMRRLLAVAPGTPVVLFSIDEQTELGLSALEAGAAGFLSKDIEMDALGRALTRVVAGEAAISRRLAHQAIVQLRKAAAQARGMRPVNSSLTNRQWEVLELLIEERSTSDIAQHLSLSLGTVRAHVRTLLQSLGARTPAEAAEAAERLRHRTPPI
jgi:DNA-binding NarL/FixJ family response regulator